MSEDTRYPYTYACDLLRSCSEYNEHGCRISRSEASQIRQLISKVLGINDEEVAKKLADYFNAHEDELSKTACNKLMKANRKVGSVSQ